MKIPSVIADRIVARLARLPRSQAWLAQQCDVRERTLRHMLAGEQDVPLALVEDICALLRLPGTLPVPPQLVPVIRAQLAGRLNRHERTHDWLAEQIGMKRSSLSHALRGTAEMPLDAWQELTAILALKDHAAPAAVAADIQQGLNILHQALTPMPMAQRVTLYRVLAECLEGLAHHDAAHAMGCLVQQAMQKRQEA